MSVVIFLGFVMFHISLSKACKGVILICLFLFLDINSYAIPSFSRQTDKPCSTCHLNFGELTHEGRKFKLMGYTMGGQVLPLSVMATASVTKIKNTSSSFDPSITLAKNDQPIFEEANLFVAGKFWENVGGYIKWTTNLANTNPIYASSGVQTGTKVGQDTYLDASEIRFSKESLLGSEKINWGLGINNSPTVQDLWSTSPVYGFPYRTSSLQSAWGLGQFGPTSMMDGGLESQIIGLSAYAMFDDSIYVELSDYIEGRPGWATLSTQSGTNTVRSGSNPYWRIVWSKNEGENSFMLGGFGMTSHLSRDPLVSGSASGTYFDYGFDTQFQHITNTHSFSAQSTIIYEDVNWGSRSVGRSHDNLNSNLVTQRSKLTYDYLRKYGLSVFEFSSKGTVDNLYWSFNPDQTVVTGACNQNNSLLTYCSSNGSPNTSGGGFELYYDPIPYVHMVFQQTYYKTFLGGQSFVDNTSGLARSASDNNLSYFYVTVIY